MSARYSWHPFDQFLWHNQPLPPEKRRVLVILPARPEEGMPSSCAVGWMKYGAGERDSPYFVIPGIGGTPTYWCDCLGDNFQFPPEV